ncbi:extracellular catalytic domain type 1 short-chain-length polyhydroxyalkanoate depolymerase [Actinoallomurus rhizosphaericola]|uniref:extracellular catalytic domain type 1 short-chain-length polyhydroxyalkanoate depolymerase n=1 Tax=Actinoallomurus rhizosphaericola TaxID=2952536 RepID=UPI002093C9B7|nr:PHB depolymerase family esterase [Actinoallomurus rhizosphaericola]MCO5998214.1 PHB depolymerase family esterase [Actinoallomurus rhizosphaericola]
MKRLTTMLAGACAAVLCAVLAVVLAHQATAAGLVQVTDFGDNPGNLQMYVYRPDSVPASPAIVLAMHPCGGSGPGFYSSSEFASLADRYGFIVIFPSASKKMNCFDNWSDASKVRGGRTDPVSLMSMVTYTERQYHGDPNQVFVTGSSSGAMMTNAMAALYPEVFKAGAAFMGVPFTCFPNEASYNPGGNSAPCVGKTAQQWGDAVRQANPSYQGPWPRMQLWHGTSDPVVSYAELAEEVKQWTNVHGLSTTPTSTDTPQSGWTRQRFADSSGAVQVEAISVAGAGHTLPMSGMAAAAIRFFGLDTGGPTPPTSPTPPPSDSACWVAYTPNTWNNGFTGNVTITNHGTAPVNGWTLTWTWPGNQQITGTWNAAITQSGAQVTARNASFNATIAPGAQASFGFQGTYSGTNASPAGFALNGTACTIVT